MTISIDYGSISPTLVACDIDIRFAQVDAKLDAKPGFAALYQAVATLAFGIGAVVTSTVVVLKNVGLMGF